MISVGRRIQEAIDHMGIEVPLHAQPNSQSDAAR